MRAEHRLRLLLLAAAVIVAIAALSGSAAAKTKPAYCNIATSANPAWAFHTNNDAPITGTRGTFAHGHGQLTGSTASGIICEVDRVPGTGDLQITLTVSGSIIRHVHGQGVTSGGYPANILELHMQVKTSTDPACKVGTTGTLTLLAPYNGVKGHDQVTFSFQHHACSVHAHSWAGAGVVALIPA